MAEGWVTRTVKENVVIRREIVRFACFLSLAAKLRRSACSDRELLQAPLVPLAGRTGSMSFDASDASGWDECLPSVAGCTVETDAGVAAVPDHGDLWRVEWEIEERDGKNAKRDEGRARPANSVRLRGDCFSLPLTLERTLDLKPTRTGWELQLQYTLTNTGRFAVPWSWAAHPLFAAEAGDRIVLPDSMHTLRLEGSGGGTPGKQRAIQ